MGNIEINQYVVGLMCTNCYVVINKDTREALVIDPGERSEFLIDKLKNDGVKPVAVLVTHGHFDHINGAEAFAEAFGIRIYIHEDDRETLSDIEMNASNWVNRQKAYHADVFLKDEQELDLAGIHIRVLHTPGHTPGGCCYYLPYENVVFTGDSLFCQSVGRTDFKKSSHSALIRSVKAKLLPLPEQTIVYPGHEETTTIGHERIYNPYLV